MQDNDDFLSNDGVSKDSDSPAPYEVPTALSGRIDHQGAVAIIAQARGMNDAAAEVFLAEEMKKGTLSLMDESGFHVTPDVFRQKLGAV